MKIKLHEDPSNVEVGEFCGDYFATPPLLSEGFRDFGLPRKQRAWNRIQIPDPDGRDLWDKLY